MQIEWVKPGRRTAWNYNRIKSKRKAEEEMQGGCADVNIPNPTCKSKIRNYNNDKHFNTEFQETR
jgi:hypothetical protein